MKTVDQDSHLKRNPEVSLKQTSLPLILFFILASALSWCAYIPLAPQAQGLLSSIPAWPYKAGDYGPAAAALALLGLVAAGVFI